MGTGIGLRPVPVGQTQSAWNPPTQNTGAWDSDISDERKYAIKEDTKREDTRMQEIKRRRMMG